MEQYKTGFTATVYVEKYRDDCRYDICNMDSVFATPEEVIDEMTTCKLHFIYTFQLQQCHEYYDADSGPRSEDVCSERFDAMIQELRECVAERRELLASNSHLDGCSGSVLSVEEEFEDVVVKISALKICL